MRDADMVIDAPPEMVAQMFMRGHRKDVDKEYEKMTPEGMFIILSLISLNYRKGCL